jgi:hypothetical protein
MVLRRAWRLRGQYQAKLDCSMIRHARAVHAISPGAVYHAVPADQSFALNIRESACAMPSMIFMEDDGLCWAMFTTPAAKTGELSAARGHVTGGFSEIGITVPGGDPGVAVDGAFEYERTFTILYRDPGAGAFRDILEQAWDLPDGDVADGQPSDWTGRVGARVETLLGRYFIERMDATGFVAELSPAGFPVHASLTGGGPGGNVAAARALYRIAAAGGHAELRRRALAIADFFQEGFESHELACDTYLLASRRWQAPAAGLGHVRSVAASCREYLLLYEAARRTRDHNPRWLRSCRHWLGPRVKAALTGVDAAIAEPFTAAYLVSALCAASRLTGGGAEDTAAAAQLAAVFMPRCIENAWLTPPGPPGAADAAAALRALLDLHEAVGDPSYLHAATGAGLLLISYTIHPAAAANAGGVIDSPGGGALYPTAASAALELLRLAEAAKQSAPRHVALAQLNAAAARADSATTPWPGADPDAIRLSGRATGLPAATPTAMIAAALDIQEHFPNAIKIVFSKENTFKSEGPALDRALLHLGSYLNFKK